MLRHYDDLFDWNLTTTIAEEQDGYYRFEDTIFYGPKGGMLADHGSINGQPVLDLKWEGDRLFHKVAEPLSNPIHLALDGKRRLLNSQIQSALHLLDGYYRPYDIQLTAVSVEPGNQWYQINSNQVTEEDLAKVENHMQDAILAAIPVTYEYYPGSKYPDPAYAQHDEVRVVSFGNLDRQPCGTPHVNNTSQIASFVILGQKKHGDQTRVEIAVGLAASQLLQAKNYKVEAIRHLLNTKEETIVEDIEELIDLKKKNKDRLKVLSDSLADYQSEAIAQSPEIIIQDQVAIESMRQVSQNLLKHPIDLKILTNQEDGVCHFSIVSPAGQARDILKSLEEEINLKGGGSPKIVSGRTEDAQEVLVQLFSQIVSNLK